MGSIGWSNSGCQTGESSISERNGFFSGRVFMMMCGDVKKCRCKMM